MCGGSRVFKLALELKQGSCLFTSSQENLPLPPVCDAFKHSKGSSYSFVGTKRGREGGQRGPK